MKLHNGIFAGLVMISFTACVTRTVYVSQPPPPDQQVYTPAPQPVAPPPTAYQQQQQVAPPPQPYQQPQPQVAPPPQPQQAAPVGYDQFYNELAPYGQWVNYGNYGYVWIPAAGANFVPYSTAGHWEYTDNGWMWVSEYQWGWAPFHYGRWEFDAFYGWFWIPGNEWAPAWVSWRNCNGYYGWAPLGYGCGWDCNNVPESRFVFVNAQYINDPYVYNHYEPRDHYHDYYTRSNFINRNHYDQDNRVTYNGGPEPTEASRYTGSVISPVHINPAPKPGQSYNSNGGIEIYRPHVNAPQTNAPQPAPRNVVDMKQV
ncbi:MAG TPA: DUF6600 domain-containing protein, partial [Bacteroidia bacterium]|nr:DUF6600 domain-containing protein [Bacteroidia bacterium]